jgi:hypothetical protein
MKNVSTSVRIAGHTFFFLVIAILFTVLIQVAHRARFPNQAYAVVGFVFLFPWGTLAIQAMFTRKFTIGLAWRTLSATLIAWTGAVLIVDLSVLFSKNPIQHNPSLLSLSTDIGLIFSCVVFGTVQWCGWVHGITEKKRKSCYAVAATSAVTGIASVLWVTALSAHSNHISLINRSWIAIFGVLLGPTILAVTGILTYFLQKKTLPLNARI